MNPTIEKFGWPATLVAEYEHWLVLLRPSQPTLGSLVLAAKSDATAFSRLEPAAFAGLHSAIGDIEGRLADAVGYAKINYLMLMMVDRNVHFHVIPRYDGVRSAEGIEIEDKGWPGMPALSDAVKLEERQIAALVRHLKEQWPRVGPLFSGSKGDSHGL